MEQAIPVETLHLFPVLDQLLLELLASLSPDDWHKPTVAGLWNVKDVAAHLLDGNIRALAASDDYRNPQNAPAFGSYQELVLYLNQLNGDWVNAMKRVSPAWLSAQLESTGKQYIDYLHSLKPFAPAIYPVAWAGEEVSANWFHIAREYTEKWHHQQQIRDAVGRPGIMHPSLFNPCLATFMYALPHAYRDVRAASGTVIKFTIATAAGGEWYLEKIDARWILSTAAVPGQIKAAVTVTPDTAWRLFTKAIDRQTALQTALVQGGEELTLPFFNTLAIMA